MKELPRQTLIGIAVGGLVIVVLAIWLLSRSGGEPAPDNAAGRPEPTQTQQGSRAKGAPRNPTAPSGL